MEAAAGASAAGASALGASVAAGALEPPQAARVRAIARTSSREMSFFIFVPPKSFEKICLTGKIPV